MLTMYGIKNCDTIKKARRWLEEQHIDYVFHDYRTDGISNELLHTFCDNLGWQALLNIRGTTWRKLTAEEKDAVNDLNSAVALMLSQPSIIKRPLLKLHNKMLLGFSADSYQQFTSEVNK